MHSEQQHPRRPLLDRDLEPAERVVDIAEAGVQDRDPPRRGDARRAGFGQLGENSARFLFVPSSGFYVRQPERRTRHPGRYPSRLRQLGARFVETAQLLEGARKPAVRAVEAWIELDRHPEMEDRFLVLAGEVVGVA